MLHPRWFQYTEDEINRIKRHKCFKCPYSSVYGLKEDNKTYANCTCDYILITKQRRICRSEDCLHYKDKTMRSGKEKFTQL